MKNARRIWALILVFMSIFSVNAQSSAGSKYIGYKYEVPEHGGKLGNGFTHDGVGLIGDIDADPLYGVSILSKGKTKMFWLEISTARGDGGGVTAWEVKDVLEFSNLGANDFVMEYPGFECRKDKTQIAENLIGIGTFTSKSGIFKPRKLWRPDAKTATFKPFSITNVHCIYTEP